MPFTERYQLKEPGGVQGKKLIRYLVYAVLANLVFTFFTLLANETSGSSVTAALICGFSLIFVLFVFGGAPDNGYLSYEENFVLFFQRGWLNRYHVTGTPKDDDQIDVSKVSDKYWSFHLILSFVPIFVGDLIGVFLVWMVVGSDNVGLPDAGAGVSTLRAFGIEALGTALLVIGQFYINMLANTSFTNLERAKILGFLMIALKAALWSYTTANLSIVRWFAAALVDNDGFNSNWWAFAFGPIVGAVIGFLICWFHKWSRYRELAENTDKRIL